ncbi:MAG: hypothetical protein LBM98_00805 [Oscillospiraceae bacterium]|nr:hypothetical protein [Oscillospiraceae bacterium]
MDEGCALRGNVSVRGAGRRQGLPCPARHCEAPISPRYVQRYRCEAIQCRGDNIQRIAGYYVNPGLLRRISLTTYRKCGGGFAKTGRASPCPFPRAGCPHSVDFSESTIFIRFSARRIAR